MYIKDQVEKLTKKFKTNDPFILADNLNITAKPWPFPDEIKGLYQYYKRGQFIYINNNLTINESKFVCGHELGHAVLHNKINALFLDKHTLFRKNKFENEANLFSAHLLLSDEFLFQYKDFTFEQIAAITEVPVEYLKLLI